MYKPLSIIAIATATAFSLGSCASSSKEGLKSLDASLLSDSIAAGSDFYEHVTERWQKAHPSLPNTRATAGSMCSTTRRKIA